jgi:hypothetical protein
MDDDYMMHDENVAPFVPATKAVRGPCPAGAPPSRPWYPQLHLARAECRRAKARGTAVQEATGWIDTHAVVRRERCTRRVGEPGVNLT